MSIAPDRNELGLRRHFTIDGISPYDEVTWERRDARLTDWRDGSVSFEQLDVEFPASWSLNATNIVAQKYFRGALGTAERETSLRQVIDRVVGTIAGWGRADGYFGEGAAAAEAAAAFADELTWLLLHQRMAFNSPVWFNIGVAGARQQASACFILSVDDSLDDILEWYAEEGRIFKGGSGSGVNLSKLRGAAESIRGGGQASGPVSFMRGADASAGTIKSGGTTRRAAKMVVLDVDHPDVEEFIWCKAREERKARVLRDAGFEMDLDGADSHSIQYQNANNSVRLSDDFMAAVEADEQWGLVGRLDGEVLESVPARRVFRAIAEAAWECADPGIQFDTTINGWHTTPNAGRISASNPCSEYLHLDDSACNLASLNLLPFLSDDLEFDIAGFAHAVEVTFTAMDILVGHADYPTEAIARNTRAYRQLGIGYTNLGATLMAQGLAYDSAEGRSFAAAVTALMSGTAYATSARMAAQLAPFDGFEADRAATTAVIERHRDAVAAIDEEQVDLALLGAAQQAWDAAVDGVHANGVRNAQASVLAPTGTISFMMDCDTTGIEPDLGLVKYKKLVGGGTMTIVNQTVPRALRQLGYSATSIAAISDHILEQGTIVGAPGLDPTHLPVFACSMGDNTIGHMGHIQMMASVQPFLSGAISKTVNLPESASVDDIEELHLEAWKLGLKAVAVYRDNCKVGQPLSTTKDDDAADLDEPAADTIEVLTAPAPVAAAPARESLPRTRASRTFSFRVADCHGFMTVGEYDDGRPGEIFLTVAKQGSTLAGIMDAFAISVSHGLQYGVPLRAYVEAYSNVRFEPAGITDDPDLRIATSLVDYLFRRLALEYLPVDERTELGILTSAERTEPTLPGFETVAVPTSSAADLAGTGGGAVASAPVAAASSASESAPLCFTCGDVMARAGSCYTCRSCGSTSGCS